MALIAHFEAAQASTIPFPPSKWALSNLVALLRWNLFAYRDLWLLDQRSLCPSIRYEGIRPTHPLFGQHSLSEGGNLIPRNPEFTPAFFPFWTTFILSFRSYFGQ